MLLFVRGGIAQDHERRELFERLDRAGAFHFLWFIEDQDGAVARDDVDGAARLEVAKTDR
jgi:hypothetical protein